MLHGTNVCIRGQLGSLRTELFYLKPMEAQFVLCQQSRDFHQYAVYIAFPGVSLSLKFNFQYY